MTFRAAPRPRLTALAAVTAALLLAGCASTAIDQNFQGVQRLTQDRLGAEVKWLSSDEARRQAQADVDATLAQPLTADAAVRLALAHSPALQAALFEGAAASAGATQSARLPNPIFTFERLVRREGGETELDIGRMLGISVFDFLLLPARQRRADFQQQQIQLRLASDVVQSAIAARQNWVRAVAAQQSLQYFEQVKQTADASAELARRMQSVGNFNRLQRAREQAFAADAVAQLARARHVAQSSREALVRSLGLNEAQARRLTLPDRLPDLPKLPKQEADIAQQALDQRLDVRLARADLEFTARDQGLSRVTSFVNGLHVAAVRNSETGEPPQKGYELELPLPMFDFGDASRARSQATYMAALNRTAQIGVEASSQVREHYAAYRTTYDVAKHYLEEVVPLRKTIADENLLRYNGMLIGVFELLADAREQVGSVVQAIEALRDFWLADAALQAALIGTPTGAVSMQAAPAASGGGADGGH
ncbi:TolC family protein [Caldimonas brevitalea]|uniref:Metal transporter n=1 Tax=Caldimonas brevitalea TaxID=413882 RepID=A0A0G3BCT5_9BURK|nr:TolC family protein [Caldimonas brevitalea]AKJ27142.1 metal transporter [Caldimonas brevitalea]